MEEPLDQNHTSSTGHMENLDSFTQRMHNAAVVVDMYYTPLLFIFGTLGNSLSLAVFCMNAKYRSQSASYYLSALAISDTGFLVNLLAVWLEGVLGGIITAGLMCPLVMYLGQVTCFISVYLTVAFSIERYVAVHYPLSRPRICTRSKARKIIAALTGVALLFFSYAWVIAQVVEFQLPQSREDYDEISQSPVGSFNLTEDSFELLAFPAGKRQKRDSFLCNASISPRILVLYEQEGALVNNTHVFGKVQNCGNGSHDSYKSIHFLTQNPPHNCTRLHLDRMTLKGFQTSYHSTQSSSEDFSSTSAERTYEAEKNLTDEDFSFPVGYACSVPAEYFRISQIANYLDSLVTLIIPFFLITFFNVRIAICVWKLQRQRQSIMATPGGGGGGGGGSSSINHHHHRHSSLRCSNKSSTHHQRKPSAKSRCSGKSSRRRQHLSEEQRVNSLKENGVRRNDSLEHDFEKEGGVCKSKSHKTTVRFQETRGRCTSSSSSSVGTICPGNKTISPSPEREENSIAENCSRFDDNASPSGNTGGVIQGLNPKPKRIDTTETLKANSECLGKSTSPGSRFGSEAKMKWEQKHKAVPSRVTAAKTEFSITREKGSTSNSSHHPASNAAEVRVTKTLLLVSTVFLVLNLPSHAIRCAQLIQSLRGISEGYEGLQAAQMWANVLFNTNFAVNFLLYCLSGRNFRKSLRNIVLRKCSGNKPQNSWKTMSTTVKQESVAVPSKQEKKQVMQPPRRNCRNELQEESEIVELEEQVKVPLYPSSKIGTANHEGIQEMDESMSV